MPEIARITLPSGTTYDFKDATARAAIAGGTVFLGVTTTQLTDGATTQTIVIDGESISAINGGIAIYGNGEFIYADADAKWHEIGDTGNLGDLAYKDDATGNFTPAGTVSKPTFTGSATTSTGTFTPTGTVSKPTFSGTEGNVSVTGTPAGTISSGSGTANYTPAGTIMTGTGTANYTPAGTVGTPTITVTPSTTTKYVAASATGGGSVTAGSAAACTLPVLTTSVANETLTIGWAAGEFTPNTPTAVTLPSFSSQTIATGISSATSSQPSFTGTGAELKFSGTGTRLTFSGSSMTSSGKFTPAGNVSQPTFSGDEGNVSVSGTPAGEVSQPTFTGTQGTVTVS